jgi:hypothetical protein
MKICSYMSLCCQINVRFIRSGIPTCILSYWLNCFIWWICSSLEREIFAIDDMSTRTSILFIEKRKSTKQMKHVSVRVLFPCVQMNQHETSTHRTEGNIDGIMMTNSLLVIVFVFFTSNELFMETSTLKFVHLRRCRSIECSLFTLETSISWYCCCCSHVNLSIDASTFNQYLETTMMIDRWMINYTDDIVDLYLSMELSLTMIRCTISVVDVSTVIELIYLYFERLHSTITICKYVVSLSKLSSTTRAILLLA